MEIIVKSENLNLTLNVEFDDLFFKNLKFTLNLLYGFRFLGQIDPCY